MHLFLGPLWNYFICIYLSSCPVVDLEILLRHWQILNNRIQVSGRSPWNDKRDSRQEEGTKEETSKSFAALREGDHMWSWSSYFPPSSCSASFIVCSSTLVHFYCHYDRNVNNWLWIMNVISWMWDNSQMIVSWSDQRGWEGDPQAPISSQLKERVSSFVDNKQ